MGNPSFCFRRVKSVPHGRKTREAANFSVARAMELRSRPANVHVPTSVVVQRPSANRVTTEVAGW
jgi:hypothetical protein